MYDIRYYKKKTRQFLHVVYKANSRNILEKFEDQEYNSPRTKDKKNNKT